MRDVPDRHRVAVDLVATALATQRLTDAPPEYGRILPAGWHDDPRQAAMVKDLTTVIEQLGGRLLVERLRFQWVGPDAAAPPDRRRLAFRPPTDRGELLDIVTRVLEGTLDEHSRTALRTASPREVAAHQLEFRSNLAHPEWWTIGCLPGGEPVGFVIPSRSDDSWIIASVGVVPKHRGHGYIDDVLGHGTSLLAAAGAPVVEATTDRGNTPTAAALRRCGFHLTGEEIVYSFPPGARTAPSRLPVDDPAHAGTPGPQSDPRTAGPRARALPGR